jgi:hypothetical protein
MNTLLKNIAENGLAILASGVSRPSPDEPYETWAENFVRTPVGRQFFAQMPEITRAMGEEVNDTNIQLMFSEQVLHAHMATQWAAEGLNVFELTHSLGAALMLTEPAKKFELHLPFNTFMLHLPAGIIPLFHPKHEEPLWAQRLTVHYYLSGKYADHMLFWASTSPVDRSKIEETPSEGYRKVGGFTVWNRQPAAQLELLDNDEYLSEQAASIITSPELQHDNDLMTHRAGLRLLRNFCSWLLSTGGLGKHQPINQKAVHAAGPHKTNDKGEPVFPVWIMGHDVKLPRELRDAATDAVLAKSSKPRKGWHVRVAHVVRGHLKHVAHGHGRSERKMVWVQPYWRNTESEVAWAHVYKPPT